MMTPLEYVAKYVTPHIRALVVHQLNVKGYSQYKLSQLLGISQPMINKILKNNKEYYIKNLKEQGIPEEEVKNIVNILVEKIIKNKKDFLWTMAIIELSIITRELVCYSYKRKHREIPDPCSLMQLYHVTTDPYLIEVKDVYRELASLPDIQEYIPEVGTNIILLPPNARTFNEAIGFPGRIVKLNKGIRAVGPPTYGGSRHTASILLTVNKKWKGIRACIVLKRDKNITDKAKELGMKTCLVSNYENEIELIDKIKKEIEKRKEKCDIIDALPAKGMEPVIYVLGENAYDVLEKIKKLIGYK